MDLDLQEQTSEGAWYTPDFAGNLELPEELRAKLRIVPLTGRELKNVERGMLAKTKVKSAKHALLRVADFESKKKEQVICAQVKELKGWFIKGPDGAREELTDIKTLLDVVLLKWRNALEATAFIDELYDRIVGESSVDEGLASE